MTELDLTKLTYVEQRVANESKSTGVSYLFWLLLGTFGAHRFYLNRATSGAILLLTNLIGIFCLSTVGNDVNKLSVATLCFAVVWIWWFIDLFMVPSIIKQEKQVLRNKILNDL